MKKFRIVIDTNVMVSAPNSRKGASYQLFRRLDSDAFDFYISVPMFLEYEAIISNYSGIFRDPFDLGTDFSRHKIQKGSQAFCIRTHFH